MVKSEKRQEKREKEKFEKNFYHASKSKLKPGDRISPMYPKKNFENCGCYVFLTPKPYPHSTIWQEAFEGDWDVYEVKPTGKVSLGMCYDYRTEKDVIVIRRVGTAKGLALPGNLSPKQRKVVETYKQEYRTYLKRDKQALDEELAKENPDEDRIEMLDNSIRYYEYLIRYPVVLLSKVHTRQPVTTHGYISIKNSKALKK